jgi:hypothetical protein
MFTFVPIKHGAPTHRIIQIIQISSKKETKYTYFKVKFPNPLQKSSKAYIFHTKLIHYNKMSYLALAPVDVDPALLGDPTELLCLLKKTIIIIECL